MNLVTIFKKIQCILNVITSDFETETQPRYFMLYRRSFIYLSHRHSVCCDDRLHTSLAVMLHPAVEYDKLHGIASKVVAGLLHAHFKM